MVVSAMILVALGANGALAVPLEKLVAVVDVEVVEEVGALELAVAGVVVISDAVFAGRRFVDELDSSTAALFFRNPISDSGLMAMDSRNRFVTGGLADRPIILLRSKNRLWASM